MRKVTFHFLNVILFISIISNVLESKARRDDVTTEEFSPPPPPRQAPDRFDTTFGLDNSLANIISTLENMGRNVTGDTADDRESSVKSHLAELFPLPAGTERNLLREYRI